MRGGPGRGQGRKPGSTSVNHTKTREIIQKAAEDNVLPLQVMFDNIRFYTKEADKLVAKLLADGVPQLEMRGDDARENPHAGIIEALKTILGFRKAAGEEAARATQYVHPRQGIVGQDAPVDDFVPLAERLKYYQCRDDIAAAGAKVVELKPQGD